MIGKYGMMRRTFLEEHRPAEYAQMLRTGTLTAHLESVSDEGKELLREQMEALERAHPAPDRRNQLERVRHMNALKHMAEEVVSSKSIIRRQTSPLASIFAV